MALSRQQLEVSARCSQMLISQMAVGPGAKRSSTRIQYFDGNDELIFTSFVPASPGNGSFSFFGIVFDDARIASVRIKAGDVAPGPNDDRRHDIVMMDDFIYGEPQLLP